MNRKLVFSGTALLGLLAAALWFGWRWQTTPTPPEVHFAGVDSAVVEVVQAALQDVRRQPRSGEAWGKLAMVLAAHDFSAEAVACYAHAERFAPADPRWPYLQGVLLLARSPRDGIPLLRKALRLADAPEERSVIEFRLALVLIEDGQLTEAEARLDALRRREPDSPRIHYGLGLLGAACGDWATARTHLGIVADQGLGAKKACTILATLPDVTTEEARAFAERAEGMPQDFPWPDPFEAEVRHCKVDRMIRIAQFRELERQGRLPEAIAFLRQFAAQSPDAEVCYILGYTLCDQSEFEEAAEVLRQVIRIDPRNVKACYFLGAALLRSGEQALAAPDGRDKARKFFQEAVAAEDRTIALQSDHGYAHLNRGRALMLLGRTDEALRALRQALLCRPEFADMHLALGEALAEAGQLTKALEHLENAARLAAPIDRRAQEALKKWRTKAKSSS